MDFLRSFMPELPHPAVLEWSISTSGKFMIFSNLFNATFLCGRYNIFKKYFLPKNNKKNALK
jgi:hypothetical protein